MTSERRIASFFGRPNVATSLTEVTNRIGRLTKKIRASSRARSQIKVHFFPLLIPLLVHLSLCLTVYLSLCFSLVLPFSILIDDALTNSDNAALCVTRAYYHFQQKQLPDAIKYCRQSLKYDSKYSPAWRCIALIEWSQGQRVQAIDHFKKSLKLFAMNPYCLRSAATANALMGNFQEAVHMIQAAVEIGGVTHALSWRAAAQITYLYGKRGTEPGAEPGNGNGDGC
jgi:tetratricopeptide (TPR) repeat protein